jgi:uncharacterized protein involved in exopolysaccharide biosynthesis
MPTPDFDQYVRVVLKRGWLIALLVISTVGTVVGVSLTRPPVFRTTLRFQVTSSPPSDVSLYQTTRSTASSDEIAKTRANFLDVVTSLDVAWETVEALGLPMSGRELVNTLDVQEAIDSDFVRLSVTTENAQLSADIANTLIAIAVRRYGEMNARPLTLAGAFIADQLTQTQAELNTARADLISFQVSNNIGTLDGAIDAKTSMIRSLELSHDEAVSRGDLAGAAAYTGLIRERQRELQDLIRLSGVYSTLATRVVQLQQTYDFLLEKRTEAQLKENQARNLDFVQVFGQARVPDSAEPQISIAILVLSIAVASAVGVMLAFAWEYVGTRRRLEAGARVVPAKQYT